MEGGLQETAAEQIRHARLRRGLTQDELARIIGTSRRVIIRWEAGHTQPNTKHRRLLRTVLGLPLGYLNGADVTDK